MWVLFLIILIVIHFVLDIFFNCCFFFQFHPSTLDWLLNEFFYFFSNLCFMR
jgi:hypothetical protein